ncbi:hypothetical protein ACET98_05350, partial [Aeromonas veronii]
PFHTLSHRVLHLLGGKGVNHIQDGTRAQKKAPETGAFFKNNWGSLGWEPETTGPRWCAPPVCKAVF